MINQQHKNRNCEAIPQFWFNYKTGKYELIKELTDKNAVYYIPRLEIVKNVYFRYRRLNYSVREALKKTLLLVYKGEN